MACRLNTMQILKEHPVGCSHPLVQPRAFASTHFSLAVWFLSLLSWLSLLLPLAAATGFLLGSSWSVDEAHCWAVVLPARYFALNLVLTSVGGGINML